MLTHHSLSHTVSLLGHRAGGWMGEHISRALGPDRFAALLRGLEGRLPAGSFVRSRFHLVCSMAGDLNGAAELLERRVLQRLDRPRSMPARPRPSRGTLRPLRHDDARAALKLMLARLQAAGVSVTTGTTEPNWTRLGMKPSGAAPGGSAVAGSAATVNGAAARPPSVSELPGALHAATPCHPDNTKPRHCIVPLLVDANPIVEVDGCYHAQRAAADRRRQRWLEKQGHRVVRLSAVTVLQETAAAVHAIFIAVQGLK